MMWYKRDSRVNLGLIPFFFNEEDELPAKEQLHLAYAHGGGVHPFDGFVMSLDRDEPLNTTIKYPGDPAYQCLAYARLRNELILFFPHSWLTIVQPDDSFIATRVD